MPGPARRKTTTLHVRLTDEADKKLRAVANELGLTMTATVEMLIRQAHKAVIEKGKPVIDASSS